MHPKFSDIPELPDGKFARCEREVVRFDLNGGQGPHLRLVLCGKRGHAGGRQMPEAQLEEFDGRDALDVERWRPFDPRGRVDLAGLLAHLYLALTGRALACKLPERCSRPDDLLAALRGQPAEPPPKPYRLADEGAERAA